MRLQFLCPAFYLLSLQLADGALAAKPKNAILLSEVQSLTLRADRQTAHRRVPAIPQLKCISGRALCSLHKIDVMRCVNQGAGYDGPEDIQWACTASLPSTLKLGSTDVICEGYSSPNDPYVLKGSCGVEYRLVLTDEGERRYPDLAGGSGGAATWFAYLFAAVFVAIAAWIVYSACIASGSIRRQPANQRRGNGGFWGGGGGGGWWPGGGGGGGGGGPWDDPPPPYPGSKPSYGQGWRPGFWTGLAGGAAAGYMAGNRGRQNEYNYGAGNPGFWGGGGNRGYGSTWGSGSSRSGSSGSASSSGARHESTGFGSTSRR
ncbi:hypothetical protein VTK73DRAFT_7473 [Phialemonium thermophilum]|uniref:Store-operated calcium entry-associated regulatory factor n=1 Tax=Phialemonium thermophilum TaxID=223376 RepID=A0ABR3XSZ9_9PEZI